MLRPCPRLQICEAGTPNTCCTEPTLEAACSNKCGKITVNKCGKDYEFACPGCPDGEQVSACSCSSTCC